MNCGSSLTPLLIAALIATTTVSAFVSSPSLSTTGPAFVSSHSVLSTTSLHSTPGSFENALIFDCDGVIIETEELHRIAYNAAFREFDLTIDDTPVEWSVAYYDILQNTVGGGKGKMFYHFRNYTGSFPMAGTTPAPTTPETQQDLVDRLQARKTELYKDLIAEKAVPRPGVIELMDEALADPTTAVGVCSASTKAAVTKVLDVTLGPERRAQLNVCILGDDVSKLKPDPMIYNTAAERLGIDPAKCVVVEDSMVGLRAAKGAVSNEHVDVSYCPVSICVDDNTERVCVRVVLYCTVLTPPFNAHFPSDDSYIYICMYSHTHRE